jgi:long-chain acyl-CoA synthetase
MDLLNQIGRHHGDAVIDGMDRISFAHLEQLWIAHAAKLASTGVRTGDRVGTILDDGHPAIAAGLGTLALGAVHVPIDCHLTMSERDELIQRTAVAWLVDEDGVRATGQPPPFAPFHDSAFIRYTSGTTATSRGVLLTRQTLDARITAAAQALGLQPGRRMLWSLPMAYHWAASVLAALSAGTTIIIANRSQAVHIADIIRNERTDLAYASPWQLRRLAQLPVGSLSGLREAVSTTAAIDAQTIVGLEQKHRIRVRQALGIIELGLPLIGDGGGIGDVGKPAPGFEACILDPEPDGSGELALRGPGRFDAYISPAQLAADVLVEGWFRTGDRAQILADGSVRLLGRIKDLINVAGIKVYPMEVEAVLEAHVAVRNALVYARSDSRLGEVVAAKIVLNQPAETGFTREILHAWCRQRLHGLKCPTIIDIVTTLPVTRSGKVVRGGCGLDGVET